MFRLLLILNFLKKNTLIKSVPFAFLGVVLYLLYLSFYNREIVREEFGDPAFTYFNALVSDKNESFSKPNIFIFEVNEAYLKKRNLLNEYNETNENYGYFLPRKYIIEFIKEIDKMIVTPKYLLIDYNLDYASCGKEGNISKEDRRLINLLNDHSRDYTILFPHNHRYNFLDNRISSDKVKFCSTAISQNVNDLSIRRFEAYVTQDRNYTYASILLSERNVSNFKQYDIVENRILFKNRIKNRSYWNNIHYFSTFEAIHRMPPPKYEESIILFGATHKSSEDIHRIWNSFSDSSWMSGVEIIANSVMSIYYFNPKLEMVNPYKALLLIFIYALLARIFTIFTLKKLEGLEAYVTFIFIGIFFLITISCSFYIFIVHKQWLNYLIPVLLWTLYDIFVFVQEQYISFKQNKEKS